MGHKVHPKIHRTQVIYTWDSRWFGKKNYAKYAKEDIQIRDFLTKKFRDANIDAISVERSPKNMTINILAAKPGFIIGRGGQGMDILRKEIERKFLQMSYRVKLNVQEVRSPALSAMVVAQSISNDIEKRMPFRRVMKNTIERVMKAGAQGVKITLAGRLNGVEIARRETLSAGTVPLITMRSDVDYASYPVETTYGLIGIKVWICRGEVFGRKDKFSKEEMEATPAPRTERKRPVRSQKRATK
jgi:small subunit ribosomal protein S3